ncbi:hypothetical protein LUZ60_016111 [Juncus effusus]|nr:hypothetical protein LUZ60_016111 [Juncus effusus]
MRRKGRQHGMVIYREIHPNSSKPKSKITNEFKTRPTTKFMTRVSSKPTNHSRYTTRPWYMCNCRLCSKAKGADKHKDDVSVNHLLISYSWVRFDSMSASSILNQLEYDTYGEYNLYDENSDGDYERAEENCLVRSSFKEEDEEEMGFDYVEFVKELDGEDDNWCLVGEI